VRTFVYSSEFIDDDAAAARLSACAGNGSRASPRIQRLLRGRPKEFWTRNCLLLPADGLDPLESANLHLALTGMTRFLALFPVRTTSPADRAEYNRIAAGEYDRLRDLLAMHYRATTRDDSPFRDRCRNESAPADLAHKLALFADSGRVNIDAEDHCGVDGWLAALLGQGVRPKSWDPLAETTPLATARGALASMAAEIRARTATLPMHREYIALRGASAPRLAGQTNG
jgi:tryptophan halogenase